LEIEQKCSNSSSSSAGALTPLLHITKIAVSES